MCVCVYIMYTHVLTEECECGYGHATVASGGHRTTLGKWSSHSTFFETGSFSGSWLFTLAGEGASGDFPLPTVFPQAS